MALKVGDKAPAFSMKTDGGGKISLLSTTSAFTAGVPSASRTMPFTTRAPAAHGR
jgi:hypothetical protein